MKRRDTLLTRSVSFRVTEDDKANRECSKGNEGKTGNNPPQNRSLHKVYLMHVIMSTVLEMMPMPMRTCWQTNLSPRYRSQVSAVISNGR